MKIKRIILLVFLSILLLGGTATALVLGDVFVKEYTITFDADGGIIDGDAEITIEKGAELVLPSVSKVGHTLNGWYDGNKLWPNNKKPTGNVTLKARWDIEIYDIVFIVDSNVYHVYTKYNEMPEFTGSTIKPSTENEQFTFIGWDREVEKATKDTTYVAQHSKEVRKFDVNLSLSHSLAGVISGDGKIEYLQDAEVSVTINPGYNFIGWYTEDDELFTALQTFTISSVKADYNLIAKFELITKSVNYIDSKNGINTNLTHYNITDGIITLKDAVKTGYNFIGWYDASINGNKIETINSNILQDVTLYARWDIVDYTITYNLNGGTNNPLNVATYTIETPTFSLFEPTKAGEEFLGWQGTGILTTTKVVTIEIGSTGDITFNAIWSGNRRILTLSVNGIELIDDKISAVPGDKLEEPLIDFSKYGLSGYEVTEWRTAGGTIFDFSSMPSESTIIYGSLKYSLGNGFLPYKTKFDAKVLAGSGYYNPLNITSYEELVALYDYCCFYNVTGLHFSLSYNPNISQENLIKEMEKARNDGKYPNLGTIGNTTYTGGKVGYFDISVSGKKYELELLVANPSKVDLMDQPSYALGINPENLRANNYDDFNINKILETLEVRSSNELIYALEIGVRPAPIVGSPAEQMYNKAKQILRQICDDNMTDLEKARAIYEYITLNVKYDNYAVDTPSIKNDWEKYDAWYVEGVLNNGVAVCDGIAKAYLLLAKIENIPVVRVNSTNHAWNKILIGGKWYGVDSTHADTVDVDNEIEVFTYKQFMFTDEYKESKGQIATNYIALVANTEYNYYDEVEFTNAGGQTYDLYIESQDEFIFILNEIKDRSSGLELYTFELVYKTQMYPTSYIRTILGTSMFLVGNEESTSGETVYTYIIYVN